MNSGVKGSMVSTSKAYLIETIEAEKQITFARRITTDMELKVNGHPRNFDRISNAGELLAALGIQRERVAVVVNDVVVKRAELEAAALHEGDVVEVITMVGGG